jgi:hypothetical protein
MSEYEPQSDYDAQMLGYDSLGQYERIHDAFESGQFDAAEEELIGLVMERQSEGDMQSLSNIVADIWDDLAAYAEDQPDFDIREWLDEVFS